MKKLLILGLIIFSNLSCKAQDTKAIETKMNYYNPETGISKSISYFKDINNLFDKYVGTWKGTQGTKNYMFIITKYTDVYDGLKEDKLLIRHLITSTNGTVLEDTRSTSDSNCPIWGDHFQKSSYVLNYTGKQAECGQTGVVFIGIVKNSNNAQMKLFLSQDQILLNSDSCPNGRAQQVLPLTQVLLTKQ